MQQQTNFVDEEDPGYNLRLPLLAPVGHFLVDLLAHLRLDFTRVARKQRKKALLPRVDNVDLVQAHL